MLFLLFVGVGVAWLVWLVIRFLYRSQQKQEARAQFIADLSELGDTKITFFRILRSAYERYRENVLEHGTLEYHGKLADDVNLFIDSIEFPLWLDGRADSLNDAIKSNVDGSAPGWNFAVAVYREIEGNPLDEYPNLLTEEQGEKLHRARRHLSHVYSDLGNQIKNNSVRLANVEDELVANSRAIKMVCYFSVVLHHLNYQHGPGSRLLYFLGAKANELLQEREIGGSGS